MEKFSSTIDKNLVKQVLAILDCKPDNKHCEFLKTRPWWNDKHTKANSYLLSIFPGTHLVAHPHDHKEITKFLKFNGEIKIYFPTQNNLILQKMEENQCHDNSLKLLNTGRIVEMHSGYALSSDGLWRHHSWGLDKNGCIVETTETRLVYLRTTMNSLRSSRDARSLV